MVVAHTVKGVIGYLINLQALEFVCGHVVQGDTHVALEERVSVESYLIYVTPQICHLTILVFQSGQTTNQVQQYTASWHLVGIGIEYYGISALVHPLELGHNLHLLGSKGIAVQHNGIQSDYICVYSALAFHGRIDY